MKKKKSVKKLSKREKINTSVIIFLGAVLIVIIALISYHFIANV
jgi:hypothetical protein